jgi:hypothetical protein
VAVLALKAMLVLTAPPAAEAYNICTCQCCYSGICIDRPNSEEWNGTFQVRAGCAARLQPRPHACGSPYELVMAGAGVLFLHQVAVL